ncbi:DnaJ domain [Trypanosoma vivax]|nr:hypothetical protein TRVL_04176 [Trypanosoma vivax]KAH8607811.1 DnaJ domain [Trypanosoma vivax]
MRLKARPREPLRTEASDSSGAIGRKTLANSSEFAAFVNRMKAVNYPFIVKKHNEVQVVVLPEPTEDCDVIDEKLEQKKLDIETKWLDLCLHEFIRRKSRYGSLSRLIIRISSTLFLLSVALWYTWPLWEKLIDVESELHYSALGIPPDSGPTEIKRAYREAVKRRHPDLNPNCESCRAEMIKIQQAHDILLAKGSQRSQLVDRYREQLDQLRSLVFFRMYSIVFSAAEEIYFLIYGPYAALRYRSETEFSSAIQLICRALTMGIFVLYDALFVSGFNIVVFLQVFCYCVSSAKFSAEKREAMRMVRYSYMDIYREAAILTSIPVIFHFYQKITNGIGHDGSNALEFILQMCFGCIYVLAHLYRMTPNIIDNMAMKKCSIPLVYLALPSKQLSGHRFIFTELGLLFDDLFAFTCRVPSVYRIVVIFVHAIFLCQLVWLPWEPPVLLKRKCEPKKAAYPHEKSKDVDHTLKRNEELVSRQSLSSDEASLLRDLDYEAVLWSDVVMTKYKKQLDHVTSDYVRRCKGSWSFELMSTADLQEVVFVSLTTNHHDAPPKLDVLFRAKDASSGRILGLQRGPLGCFPTESLGHQSIESMAKTYARASGEDGKYTPSELWLAKFTRSC